jgi:hypothetical protein
MGGRAHITSKVKFMIFIYNQVIFIVLGDVLKRTNKLLICLPSNIGFLCYTLNHLGYMKGDF